MSANTRERVEQNNYVIDCPHCDAPNLEYVGEKPIDGSRSILKSADFRGLGVVPNPKPGDVPRCFFCKKGLF